MILKRTGLLLVGVAYLFAFAAPPLYPGAKEVDELNQASKKVGQNGTSYNTFDPFEKVYDFYKTKGAETKTHHTPKAREKYAAFLFRDTGYAVTIFFREDDRKSGTIIFVGKNAQGH